LFQNGCKDKVFF